MSDASSMSADSVEAGPRALRAEPAEPFTPETTKKNSSTFNLLKDSDLFTQICNEEAVVQVEPRARNERSPDPYCVVEVRESEIVKSTVSPVELKEIYPSEAIETVVEFIPQTVERVEIIDDTEGESICDSDGEDKRVESPPPSPPPSPSQSETFVVEVKKFEERMKPTFGILKRRTGEEENPRPKVTMNVPDLISTIETKSEADASVKTLPPPPSCDADPPGAALPATHPVARITLRRDEVNEYLILAALPEPSATEETFANDKCEVVVSSGAAGGAAGGAGEAIYSEVQVAPQARVASSSEFEDKEPLSTSTPIKSEESRQAQAQVVGVARKPAPRAVRPAPLSSSISPPASPISFNNSYSPNWKDKPKVVTNEKYQKTDEFEQDQEMGVGVGVDAGEESPAGEAELRARFPAACDEDPALVQFASAAAGMARRLHVVLVTVRAVPSERDPAKRREMLKNQLAGVAPDAAELISRGDSLVYAKHREDPALAEFLRARYQDELRGKWSTVMTEIEAERGAALRAEEGVRRLASLVDRLRRGLRDLEARPPPEDAEGSAWRVRWARQTSAEAARVRVLCGELRVQRVTFPERAALETAAAAERAAGRHDHADVQAEVDALAEDGAEVEVEVEAEDEVAGELARRAESALEAVAALAGTAPGGLRAPPLASLDYDYFPMQEDALIKIKSSMAELQGRVEDIEQEDRRLGCAAEACARLRDQWAALQHAYEERYQRL
ncbi:PREDICTED: uncharacterized protein LOC106121838 [Papilio xuthus]|uniref:Uncharacterized protein LOC106121838 n=1 Tax=Papilio xuthus TaxID=66420 RepID=A0AAJ7EDM4_PAPXU|nr:PREDICTED: uncharacterized protein LOC106121838 [Papilio xuthus]